MPLVAAGFKIRVAVWGVAFFVIVTLNEVVDDMEPPVFTK
jgi:hypothetical protein